MSMATLMSLPRTLMAHSTLVLAWTKSFHLSWRADGKARGGGRSEGRGKVGQVRLSSKVSRIEGGKVLEKVGLGGRGEMAGGRRRVRWLSLLEDEVEPLLASEHQLESGMPEVPRPAGLVAPSSCSTS